MADEFKNSGSEFNPQVENKVFRENIVPLENVTVSENQPVQESLDTTTRAKPQKKFNEDKKNHALSSLSGGLAATIGAVAVGITGTMNVQFTAELESVDYVDSTIVVKVNVDHMEEDNTLTLYLTEGSDVIDSANIVDDDQDGIIEYVFELDKDYLKNQFSGTGQHELRYRVDLKGVPGLDVERAFDSFLVKITHVGSSFNSVTTECFCERDGTFHFSIDYEDDFGLIEFISAKIEDKNGNVSTCEFSDNLHEEQYITVPNTFTGSKGTFTLEYTVNGEAQTYTEEVNF